MLLSRDNLPDKIADIEALDELLCRPSQALIDDLSKVDGDIMVLGVAGKMGPTLAGLAKAALPNRRIIGVARFSEAGVEDWLRARGILKLQLLVRKENGKVHEFYRSIGYYNQETVTFAKWLDGREPTP